MSSAAQNYFRQITSASDPAAFLSALVSTSPPTFETEWLDFKGNPKPQHVQEIWSKSISAFGNTEGGVLIWGIDARRNEEGIDCAADLSLIEDAAKLKSQLLELQHQVTDPPVSGVAVEHFRIGPKTLEGFVVCLVPESQVKPVRADRVKNKPYYIRVGTSAVIPSPSLLRSLFYPQSKSKLKLFVTPTLPFGSQPEFDAKFEVTIQNQGPATAHDVQIVMQKHHLIKAWNALGWGIRSHISGTAFYYGAAPLHPGDSSIAIGFSLSVKAGNHPYMAGFLPVFHTDAIFWFTVYSSDHDAQHFAVRFDGHEIGQSIQKQAQAVLTWPDE